jgi:hypothetical protein
MAETAMPGNYSGKALLNYGTAVSAIHPGKSLILGRVGY